MKRIFYMFLVVALFLPSMVFAEAEMLISLKDSKSTYDKAWDAAVTALYELRLPIAFMSKESGYMITEKEETSVESDSGTLSAFRVRVTLRFLRTVEAMRVKISSEKEYAYWKMPYNLSFTISKTDGKGSYDGVKPFYFWEPVGNDAALENEVRLKIISLI